MPMSVSGAAEVAGGQYVALRLTRRFPWHAATGMRAGSEVGRWGLSGVSEELGSSSCW